VYGGGGFAPSERKGKFYRIATEENLQVFSRSRKICRGKRQKLMEKWGFDPVPDEPTPPGGSQGVERAFSVRNYGLNTWVIFSMPGRNWRGLPLWRK